MPDRFFLGLGSGENLNEHIVGARWPSAPVRQGMLEEAIEIIRLRWEGGEQSYFGTYYTLDHAVEATSTADRSRVLAKCRGRRRIEPGASPAAPL